MKHQKPDELISAGATVLSTEGFAGMSRFERLRRWADALQKHGGQLNALRRIEYLTVEEARVCGQSNTPLTVAFADPLLRGAGLAGDRIGDAMDFFELTRDEAHHLLCDCHYHGAMTADEVARRLRQHARWSEFRARCYGALRRLLGRT